jgi:hypothetical protein
MTTLTITEHRFTYPTVRCTVRSTAHPVAEAWMAPAVETPAVEAPAVEEPAVEQSAEARFDTLQEDMASAQDAVEAGAERTIVVLPSRSVEKWNEDPAVTQAYEERLLCSLLELRDPNVRMTYVTSKPVAPAIVDYYLSLLPRRARRSARSRLTLVALGDGAARPLSAKLLERPRVLERIRRSLREARSAHLAPFVATALERDVALQLGIPMYGADPRHAFLGTKSGCRALFARAGVAHPMGAEGIASAEDAVAAIVVMRRARPELDRVVIKLNNGVSGEGNAIVDLGGLPAPGVDAEPILVDARVRALSPEAPGVTAEAFLAKLAEGGGVVEEWIAAHELHSPSVQLQITPSGEVRVVSTHDQILGGPTGQIYLGCRFPADPAYAPAISRLARRVGAELAAAGVIGRMAIDFVVARGDDGAWSPYAIELNLRKGGTTHPYETLAHLTGGEYDALRAEFTTPTGQRKHYVATDHLEDEELRRLGRGGVLAIASESGVRFDPMRRTGVVFHMLSSLDELGRAGFTAIADTAEQANALAARVREMLLDRAGDTARLAPGAAVALAA